MRRAAWREASERPDGQASGRPDVQPAESSSAHFGLGVENFLVADNIDGPFRVPDGGFGLIPAGRIADADRRGHGFGVLHDFIVENRG